MASSPQLLTGRVSTHRTRGDVWSTVTGEWPARLLHVPSMTSVRREGTGHFTNPATGTIDINPQYNIISYTWGRWRTDEHPAIDIRGTPWKIPAVEPDHFRPGDFESALRYVSWHQNTEYVWVDIACINQGRTNPEDEAESMDQIGKQMPIFAQASQPFVWLSRTSRSVLEDTLEQSLQAHLALSDQLVELSSGRDHRYLRRESFVLPVPAGAFPLGKERLVLQLLETIEQSMRRLCSDPWFSSLWTLQESILRRDAVILTSEGRPIISTADELTLVSLSMIANSFRTLLLDLDDWLYWVKPPEVLKKMVNLRSQTRNNILAFMACNNPNLPYSLARYRKCSEPEDRIYGIMQIYGFKLGRAVQPERFFEVGELKRQFAKILNEQHPMVAQMFVHTVEPEHGNSWQITPLCEVPEPFLIYTTTHTTDVTAPRLTAEMLGRYMAGIDEHNVTYNEVAKLWSKPTLNSLEFVPADDCNMVTKINDNQHAVIKGYAWRLADFEKTLINGNGYLMLDVNKETSLAELRFDGKIVYEGTGTGGRDVRGSRLRALRAWSLRNQVDIKFVYLGHLEKPYEARQKFETDGHLFPKYMGLVLCRSIYSSGGVWHRVGVCTWQMPCECFPRWDAIAYELW